MSIQKKPLETLKQQKESFLNYIKTKEKYSGIIADLFEDDEIEKIDNMEGVKQHLEQKGISKELTDTLEEEYTEYLRGGSYYGPIEEYPEETKEKIKENNKKLKKIKKEIIKKYNENKEIFELNVEELVEKEFRKLNTIETETFENEYYWENKIKEKNKEKTIIDEELENIQKEINKRKYTLNNTNRLFKKKKKENLEKEIENLENLKKKKEENKVKLENTINEYGKYKERAKEIERINKRKKSDIKEIMGNIEEYKSTKEYTEAIGKIFEKIEKNVKYIDEETINNIKEYIIAIICEQNDKIKDKVKEKIKPEIEKLVDEYINYNKYGENKDLRTVKTIYARNRIDPRIVEICKKLGIKTNIESDNEEIDYNFINDVFVHTTGFNVLDEILDEGGLVSTNEIMERSKKNEDIAKSRTQTETAHKDIYFSRGVKINGYGEQESEDDFIYIANTMNNFANAGYGVPLNDEMQYFGNELGETDHDIYGYSIISKSALEHKRNDASYSKIDLKDLYIFVSETKKEIIESNPKYKTKNINIIYIPKDITGKMNYQIYEFIKKQIEIKNKEKEKRMPIPRKIISNSDGIKSISEGYKWAFCESTSDNIEEIYNPIKDKEWRKISEYLEKNQDLLGISKIGINFEYLNRFLNENNDEIKNFNLQFEYPKELLTLIIIFTKVLKGQRNDSNRKYINTTMPNIISKFGYDIKDISILSNTIADICDIGTHNSDTRRLYNNFTNIEKRCNIRGINFNKYKMFLKGIAKIIFNETQFNYIMKNIEIGKKGYY